MDTVEIPYEHNRIKFLIYSIGPIAIMLFIYLIYYFISNNKLSFNPYYFMAILCVFLIFIYYTFKSVVILRKNKPCIIFDKEKITSCSIFGEYSLNINIFEGYKFVEYKGIPFINIYPKDYNIFRKQLGLHILRRLIFRQIKNSGFEGPMISVFTLSPNYQSAIDYLDKTFK